MVIKNPFIRRSMHFWKSLGSGLITGASNDDPSAMVTFIQAGASFGLQLIWLPFITIPLLGCLLEMCGRIGMTTSKGLTSVVKSHYPKLVLYLLVLISVPAFLLNMAADVAAIGDVVHLVVPAIPSAIFSFVFICSFMIIMFNSNYLMFTKILKYFSLVLLIYVLVPFFEKKHGSLLLQSLFHNGFRIDKTYLIIIVALLGANLSPYMFFWQTSMVREDSVNEAYQTFTETKTMRRNRRDVYTGTFFSNLIAFFILFTAGTVLYNSGVHDINSLAVAAKALEPLGGRSVYILFALGVIGTGAVIIPVLSSSISFIITEAFNLKEGFNKKLKDAKSFYALIAVSLFGGLVMNLAGLNPIKALMYVTTLYGLLLPIIVGLILHIANNKKVMGVNVNGVWSNFLGITILLVSLFLSIGLFVI
jgi:Mn2+/Fe2+ NRAMP family transporter